MRLPKDWNSDLIFFGRKYDPVIPWEKACFKANSFQKCRKIGERVKITHTPAIQVYVEMGRRLSNGFMFCSVVTV